MLAYAPGDEVPDGVLEQVEPAGDVDAETKQAKPAANKAPGLGKGRGSGGLAMPTLTTTEQVLTRVPLRRSRWTTPDRGRLGAVGGRPPRWWPAPMPLRIQSQGRTIYGSTKSGTTDVTVGAEAPIIGSTSGDAVVDGGTA